MEVYVKTYPLPAARELVRQNDDGSYTIVVNSSLCREQQLDVVAHALGHIKNDDWARLAEGESIGVIEAEAEVPLAMAEAFRTGNLGIMDYYRMKNLQAERF